jgi:two-component system invasion response regulator UvrY
MIRILIADDHSIIREGLKQIVSEVPDMVVADEASDGQELLSKVREEDFDVLVLDIHMPGPSGMELLRQLGSEKPKLPIVILSMYPEEQYAVRSLKAGASAYLTKGSAPDELIAAIRKVSLGGKYVTSSLAERLAHYLQVDSEKPLHEALSDREYQVLCMIASGKTVTQIGKELSLSVKTVSTYRSRILAKMGMGSNAELTRYAIENRLVQ